MVSASKIAGWWRARSRLTQAAIALVALIAVLEAAGGRPASLVSFLEFVALILGAGLAIRAMRNWLSALMWRLRHRLLITYIFIGVVPVLLLLLMGALGAYIFYGQVATYLVNNEIKGIRSNLEIAARATAHDIAARGGDPQTLIREHLPPELADLPFQVQQLARPSWVSEKDGFVGLVATPDMPGLRAAVPLRQGLFVVTVPFNAELLQHAVAGIGTVRFLQLVDAQSDPRRPRLTIGDAAYDLQRGFQVGTLPPPIGRYDKEVQNLLTIPVQDWESGAVLKPVALTVTSRPSVMNARLFSTLGEQSNIWLTFLAAASFVFLFIEVLSLWVGVRLTRTMTRAIADLYEGTEKIHSGNFAWRIPVHTQDQLAALAESFNTMTVSLAQLIQEQKEKQRLQSELEIARDVQAQLFPKEVPRLGGLDLAALCNPARTVSGDYYDFVALDQRHLALTIADIAGKGISAALLMASIQSMLHAQFNLSRASLKATAAPSPGGTDSDGYMRTAALTAMLNRQLHEATAPGNFSTFCCGMYDDATGDLTYTNAGHLPPIILHQGKVRRLEKGGVVLGIFPDVKYEQETVRLERGDLFVAFTDGITEPENSYGEEFGEERLIELLQRLSSRPPAEIVSAVMSAVYTWTASPEQPDDMTLLVARRR